jgi:ribosomal protein L10
MKLPAGELLTVEQVWELSKLWYRDRLSPEFTGRTTAEAHQIFEKLGLKTDFWRFAISS